MNDYQQTFNLGNPNMNNQPNMYNNNYPQQMNSINNFGGLQNPQMNNSQNNMNNFGVMQNPQMNNSQNNYFSNSQNINMPGYNLALGNSQMSNIYNISNSISFNNPNSQNNKPLDDLSSNYSNPPLVQQANI